MKLLVSKKVSAGFGLALIILVANILVTAIEVVPQKIQLLKQLTADTTPQQQRLDILNPLITEKLINSIKTIFLRRNQGFESTQLQLVSLTLTKPRENQRITHA